MGREYHGGEPATARRKSIAIYGAPKTMKTRIALSVPGRKFVMDFDKGAWAAAEALLGPKDVIFEPDEWPESLERMGKLADEYAKAPADKPPFDVVIADSATEGYDCCMRDVLRLPRAWGKKEMGAVPLYPVSGMEDIIKGSAPPKKGDKTHETETFEEAGKFRRALAEQRDYGLAHERWKVFIRECRKFNSLFILVAHEGINQDEDTKVIGGGMLLPGKMMQQIPLQFDYYLRVKPKPGEEGKFTLVTQHEGWWPAGYRKGRFEKLEAPDLVAFLKKAGIEL
jgi:hypothetical protein